MLIPYAAYFRLMHGLGYSTERLEQTLMTAIKGNRIKLIKASDNSIHLELLEAPHENAQVQQSSG